MLSRCEFAGNKAANANPSPCQRFHGFAFIAMVLGMHVSPEIFLGSFSFLLDFNSNG